MNYEWALDPIYKGLEDPAYAADVKTLEDAVSNFAKLVADAKEKKASRVGYAFVDGKKVRISKASKTQID